MSDNQLFEIGDERITTYQKTIIAVGIVLIVLFAIVAIVTQNKYYRFFPFIILILFGALIFLYSTIYCVSCDSNYFYIHNLFKKKKIDKGSFIKIKPIRYLDFLLVVVFKDMQFLILRKSDNYFKNVLRSNEIIANEITKAIEIHIQRVC